MLNVIFGETGSGKTKKLIDMANKAVESCKGDIVFIDDGKRYMYDLIHQVRFVDASEFRLDDPRMLYGFLCGVIARDFDIDMIFINDFLKLVNMELDELDELFSRLNELSEKIGVHIVADVSASPQNIPAFLNKYLIIEE